MLVRIPMLALLAFLPLNPCFSQYSADYLQEIKNGKRYDVWLFSRTKGLKRIGRGEIYQVYDDSLSLIKPPYNLSKVISYPIQDIDEIWLRRKNQKAISGFIGLALGFAGGVALGLSFGDGVKCPDCISFTAKEKAFFFGHLFAPLTWSMGLGMGSGKIKIPINRQKSRYLPVKKKLEKIRYAPEW